MQPEGQAKLTEEQLRRKREEIDSYYESEYEEKGITPELRKAFEVILGDGGFPPSGGPYELTITDDDRSKTYAGYTPRMKLIEFPANEEERVVVDQRVSPNLIAVFEDIRRRHLREATEFSRAHGLIKW